MFNTNTQNGSLAPKTGGLILWFQAHVLSQVFQGQFSLPIAVVIQSPL